MFELRARNRDRVALHLQTAQCEHEVPVSALYVCDRVDRALAKLCVSQRKVLFAISICRRLLSIFNPRQRVACN